MAIMQLVDDRLFQHGRLAEKTATQQCLMEAKEESVDEHPSIRLRKRTTGRTQ